MVQSEIHRIPMDLLSVAREHISHPEMHEAFGYGETHRQKFRHQLEELDTVIRVFNDMDRGQFPMDMKNSRDLKDVLDASKTVLPVILDTRTQRNVKYRQAYTAMLQDGQRFIGPVFHFHTAIDDHEQRLGAAVLDGLGLFVPHMLGVSSDEKIVKIQGTAVNAFCEMLAELESKNSYKPLSLFLHVKNSGWYDPEYGFDKRFLKRHGFPTEKKT